MRRNYKGEKLTSNLSRAAKARGYCKEMVRERQRSEKVLTDASHETAKCIPQVTIEPKRVQCRRGSAVGDTLHTSRPRTKEIVATFKKKDRRCSQFLCHSGTLDGLQSRQARRDAGSCWQGFQRIRKKIICVSLEDPFCARWEERSPKSTAGLNNNCT